VKQRRGRKGGKRGQAAPEIGKPRATLEGATGNRSEEAISCPYHSHEC